jgi:flagellar biosynthesis/type III secretory pathway M-ring protein FliF/YscJ
MARVHGYLILFQTTDEVAASFITSTLDQVGIRHIVEKEPQTILQPRPTIVVLVHESQFAEARQILAEQQIEAGGEAPPGACPFCGAPLPPSGGYCTTCGREVLAWAAPPATAPAMAAAPRLPREETNTWRFLILLLIAIVVMLILSPAVRRWISRYLRVQRVASVAVERCSVGSI